MAWMQATIDSVGCCDCFWTNALWDDNAGSNWSASTPQQVYHHQRRVTWIGAHVCHVHEVLTTWFAQLRQKLSIFFYLFQRGQAAALPQENTCKIVLKQLRKNVILVADKVYHLLDWEDMVVKWH
jgi:hypothetical protein